MIGKKYIMLKDYFLDRKQSRQFKKWNGTGILFDSSKIIFSNNNTLRDLDINTDNINNSQIIFKNSSFNNISIVECQENNKNEILFDNCIINSGRFDLSNNSNITMNNCNIRKIDVKNANAVKINNISVENVDKASTLSIECKKLNINNLNGNLNFIVSCDAVKIVDSNFYINIADCNILIIEKSSMFVEHIICKDYLMIISSKIKHKVLGNDMGIILANNINILSLNEICNCLVETCDMNMLEDSYLYIENSYFNIKNILDMKKFTYIEDNICKDSIFDINRIIMSMDSGIDICGLEYSNIYNNYEVVEFNQLKEERKKLTKVLNLLNEKYNPQIRDLE